MAYVEPNKLSMNAIKFNYTKSYLLILLLLSISSGAIIKPSQPILNQNVYETIGLKEKLSMPLIDTLISIYEYDNRSYTDLQNINQTLVDYIKDHEGFRHNMYYCLGGKPTIGWGHVIKPNEQWLYNGITQYQGDSILYKDIQIRSTIIDRLNIQHNLNLTLNQKASLIHFIYALGEGRLYGSDLFKKIKQKKTPIKEDFTQHCRVKGKPNKYAKKMRLWEYKLYMK